MIRDLSDCISFPDERNESLFVNFKNPFGHRVKVKNRNREYVIENLPHEGVRCHKNMYIFTVLILYALKPMISVYNVIVFISHSLWFVKSILRGDYQNDRYSVPKWPLFFTKMTVVWPKWPLYSWLKWPLVYHQNDRCMTKMTVILDQNDRYQNDRYWLKWPLSITKMTVI